MKQEKEKMSLHRALAELKLIDARILKAIEQAQPTGIAQKDKNVYPTQISKEEFEKAAKASFDSILALIERKNKIKCAIVKKNAETMVKIGNVEMTIAEAINNKSLMLIREGFIKNMTAKHLKAKGELEKNNAKVEANCQSIIETSVGKDNVKTLKDDVENIQKPYMERNEFHLIDPIGLEAKLQEMETVNMTFNAEVDAVLSEINATTSIEF